MLSVYFGEQENEVYNPAGYFLNKYKDEWITADLSRQMIKDVDRSEVIEPRIIDSPFLGPITPRELSGGVKTLMCMAYDDSGYVFNASACGDNCAKWIVRIAQDKDLTIDLHHLMSFEGLDLHCKILNDGSEINSYAEFVDAAVDFL